MFPEFRLIRNSENLGFAKANNIGIAECSGEYVCLVNSDVKYTSDCFSPMLRFLSENPGVGMVGPKMLASDGRVGRSTLRFPTVWNQFCSAVGLDIAFRKSRLLGGLRSPNNYLCRGTHRLVCPRSPKCVGSSRPSGPPVLYVWGGRRLVLSISPSRTRSCVLCRCRSDSLRRSQFIECAASFLPGAVLRQLAILAKTSGPAGAKGLSCQLGCLPHGPVPWLLWCLLAPACTTTSTS